MAFLLIMVATGWVVVQSTWLKRESVDGILKRAHFSGEREREIQEERGIQKDGAFERREFLEGEEKCVLGIYPLLLDTPQWLS